MRTITVPLRYSKQIPRQTLLDALAKYEEEKVKTGRAVGELQPTNSPEINLSNVSHIVTGITVKEDRIDLEVKILDTPVGKILEELYSMDIPFSMSTRSHGTVSKEGVVQHKSIIAIDACERYGHGD